MGLTTSEIGLEGTVSVHIYIYMNLIYCMLCFGIEHFVPCEVIFTYLYTYIHAGRLLCVDLAVWIRPISLHSVSDALIMCYYIVLRHMITQQDGKMSLVDFTLDIT